MPTFAKSSVLATRQRGIGIGNRESDSGVVLVGWETGDSGLRNEE